MQDDQSGGEVEFPPSAAALDDQDRRTRRLYIVETPLGALMLVVGVLGGLGGARLMWIVAVCGAGIVCVGIWNLLRYRRIAADNRYFDAGESPNGS